MIKINVISNNKGWKKYLKNPNNIIEEKKKKKITINLQMKKILSQLYI